MNEPTKASLPMKMVSCHSWIPTGFDDDVTARVKEFVRTVWGRTPAGKPRLHSRKPLFVRDQAEKGESSLDTIRRYLSTQFWKDHMK
jgi:type II restriction/modification system DNA methylase subunit YeeA